MILAIGGQRYLARVIPAGCAGTRAVRLRKQDGTQYDLVRTRDGLIECDCAWYEYRLRGTAVACKHGLACVEARLLPAPAPVPRKQS